MVTGLVVVCSLLFGAAASIIATRWSDRRRREQLAATERTLHGTAERVIDEARRQADVLRQEAEVKAKAVLLEARAEAEQKARDQGKEIAHVERRVLQKEE